MDCSKRRFDLVLIVVWASTIDKLPTEQQVSNLPDQKHPSYHRRVCQLEHRFCGSERPHHSILIECKDIFQDFSALVSLPQLSPGRQAQLCRAEEKSRQDLDQNALPNPGRVRRSVTDPCQRHVLLPSPCHWIAAPLNLQIPRT